MLPVVEQIILLLIEQVGIPFIMRVIAAKSPQEIARAALDAEYAAIRAASDAEAAKVL